MATGGSVESITLDGRTFSVAADADASIKLGGFENEVQSNGDGTARVIKTRVPFSADGLAVSVDDDNGDHEFIQALADRKAAFPLTLTLASGAIWQGTGQITGEVPRSSQNTTIPLNISGAGKLSRQ